jgi:hypothetical protein
MVTVITPIFVDRNHLADKTRVKNKFSLNEVKKRIKLILLKDRKILLKPLSFNPFGYSK